MGLFSFFNRKNGHANGNEVNGITVQKNLPEIPENVFVEKSNSKDDGNETTQSVPASENGIHVVFRFLEKNHEAKGYDDALVNPDTLHLEENVQALNNELERTIRKTRLFYEDFIREINFHINSRSRSGMVDTVEELIVKRETADSHIQQIIDIEKEAKENRGVAQGVILSYTRGFRNGLAAISHHSIMKKVF